MSGDVQPRKRKDKKRKRDDRKSEGEVIFSRKQSLQDEDESSHGVHITKMGNEDVHLHVQQEHGTGGHWCAKVIFFALMAVLLSLVGLIILENRGLADLDTPLSESRFSNYFDGWVEERRDEHDEHDAVQASLEEHDEHDEPFEEEEDHSEVDEDDDHDEHDDDDDEEDEDHDDDDEEDDDDENVTEEATAEVSKENDDDDDDDDDKDDNDDDDDNATKEDDDDDDEVENVTQSVEDDDDDEDDDVTQTAEEDDDDADNTAEDNNDDDDDNEDNDEDNDNDEDEDNTKEQTTEASDELINDNDDDNSQDNDDNDEDDDDDNDEVNETVESRQQTSNSQQSKADNDDDDDDDDPFDEEDDDGTFESLENVVVDNDAEELLLLQEKARRQAAESGKTTNADDDDNDDDNDDDAAEAAPSWASSQIKPKQKPTGGPQANDDEMEVLFEQELRKATEEMLRENYANALQKFSLLSQKHPDRPALFLGQAQCLDQLSQQRRSNQLLRDALEAFKRYLAFDEMVPNAQQFRQAAERCIERMGFMGYHNQAVPIHQQLIAHFRHDVELRNQLAVTYLTINRLAEAKQLLQETLQRWPANGFALVHYGFVLKNLDQDYAAAAIYLQKGIDTQEPDTQDGRFYFNLGDAYQRLGRAADALQTYKSGAALRLFPSAYQRSLYNVPQLRAQPYWTLAQTTYAASLEKFQHNWQAIRDEALSLLSRSNDGMEYFQNESENLRDTGHWQQYELWARGQRNARNCLKAPITCGLVQQFAAAATCRRGQVKFSLMQPETHVWPHCGPTNCRLRAHLGLLVPPGTRLRVADKESTWTEGKFLIFDDSFEHEVWHEGSAGPRLVLIVDVWHPDLNEQQRQSLTPI